MNTPSSSLENASYKEFIAPNGVPRSNGKTGRGGTTSVMHTVRYAETSLSRSSTWFTC